MLSRRMANSSIKSWQYDRQAYNINGITDSGLVNGGVAFTNAAQLYQNPVIAFDGNNATAWHTNATRGGSMPIGTCYIGFDYGQGVAKKITRVTIVGYSDGGNRFKDFALEGSLDMISWTTIANLQASSAGGEQPTAPINFYNPVAYRAYRLRQTSIGWYPDWYFALAEIRLYEI
jgi:hypothetical protein